MTPIELEKRICMPMLIANISLSHVIPPDPSIAGYDIQTNEWWQPICFGPICSRYESCYVEIVESIAKLELMDTRGKMIAAGINPDSPTAMEQLTEMTAGVLQPDGTAIGTKQK